MKRVDLVKITMALWADEHLSGQRIFVGLGKRRITLGVIMGGGGNRWTSEDSLHLYPRCCRLTAWKDVKLPRNPKLSDTAGPMVPLYMRMANLPILLHKKMMSTFQPLEWRDSTDNESSNTFLPDTTMIDLLVSLRFAVR
jgi:hypothetical protein